MMRAAEGPGGDQAPSLGQLARNGIAVSYTHLDVYKRQGHLRLDSFPLVPKNDPSLLLINSGMAPMKKDVYKRQVHGRSTSMQKATRLFDKKKEVSL